MLEPGKILRKGNNFYRVYDFTKNMSDVVCNQVLYHPKKEYLVISSEYIYIDTKDVIKNVYRVLDDSEVKQLLEIIKRKYKLVKINELSK